MKKRSVRSKGGNSLQNEVTKRKWRKISINVKLILSGLVKSQGKTRVDRKLD